MVSVGMGIFGAFVFAVLFLTPGGGGLAYLLFFLIFIVLPLVLSTLLLIRPTSLVLTTEGFSERVWGRGQVYRWTEIDVLGVLDLGSDLGRHVVFKLTDDARRRRAGLVSSMRRLGVRDYDGSVGNEYLVSTEELCGVMERWRARAGTASPPSVDSPPDERTRAI
jgi:hypothetical protein